MKRFLLLPVFLVLLACHKNKPPKIPFNPPLSNVWRWISVTVPGGLRQPAKDSAVLLVLDRDSAFNVAINGVYGPAGHYHINPDSNFMTFSVPPVLYSDSLRLCGTCALTVSADTITLKAPAANPTNYGLFTFVRPNPIPPCINCSL